MIDNNDRQMPVGWQNCALLPSLVPWAFPVTVTIVTVSQTVSVSAILKYGTWLKQTFPRYLAQLVTIIISKIILPDAQERKRFCILGARKLKRYIVLLKVDRCSFVPNNLLKISVVPRK